MSGKEPAPGPQGRLGALIQEAQALDGRAPAELFALLYRELHRLAQAQLRASGATLGATTLLHEAYLDLAAREASFPDRPAFFAYAARAMRGLLVDHVRARRALKRGGAFHLTGFDTGAEEQPGEDLSALGDALDELAESAPRLAEVVDLKFFCGFSLPEIAAMRGVSERTVQRDWDKARLLLHRSLAP